MNMTEMWRGVEILTRYHDTGKVRVGDELLLCEGWSPDKIRKCTYGEEDLATLEKFGWFWWDEIEGRECWAHYT